MTDKAIKVLAVLVASLSAAVSATDSTQRVPTVDAAPQSDQTPTGAPLPPPGEMARCKQLIDAGLYAGARARLQPIVDQHPKWARAAALLGLTYYKESRFAVAAPLFRKALELDPEELAARPFLGWSLYSLGELDEAETMFRSLVERKPEYTPAHYGLGLVAFDRDEIESARRRFERALALATAQADAVMQGRARARLGDVYVRLDDLERARRELELAVELIPNEHDALYRLSRVLQRLGDAEGAARARERYEAARPDERPEPRIPS